MSPSDGACPGICQVIVDIRDNPNSHINIGSITAYINCANPKLVPPTHPTQGSTIWDKYKWWIISGIIGFILLIVILSLVVKYMH